jgi:heme exporter protein A
MALIVDNLTVRRGDRAILIGLSFRASRGAAMLLTGPNGAGKTTLLRTIAGLLPPSRGSIRLEGMTMDPDDGIAGQCHFVGHLNAVKPALTVRENAEFWANYLCGRTDQVIQALEHFRMADLASIQAAYLSAGQKRRLGLSRLLVAPRPVWLLDEPAVSLDTASQGLLAEAVNAHLAGGGLTIAATHQPLGFTPSSELRLVADGGARTA